MVRLRLRPAFSNQLLQLFIIWNIFNLLEFSHIIVDCSGFKVSTIFFILLLLSVSLASPTVKRTSRTVNSATFPLLNFVIRDNLPLSNTVCYKR